MTDYSDLIKQTVPMDSILRRYGLVGQNAKHRIPCPLHGGEKPNFSYRDHRFRCWVCGEHGSTIDFVMKYKNVSFVDAMRSINDDFGLGLPIGECQPSEAERAARRRAEQIRQKRIERQNRLKQLCTAYDAAMDRYAALDIIVHEDAPSVPYDDVTPQYAYALKHIDSAWESVQDAAEAIRKFEREGEEA